MLCFNMNMYTNFIRQKLFSKETGDHKTTASDAIASLRSKDIMYITCTLGADTVKPSLTSIILLLPFKTTSKIATSLCERV